VTQITIISTFPEPPQLSLPLLHLITSPLCPSKPLHTTEPQSDFLFVMIMGKKLLGFYNSGIVPESSLNPLLSVSSIWRNGKRKVMKIKNWYFLLCKGTHLNSPIAYSYSLKSVSVQCSSQFSAHRFPRPKSLPLSYDKPTARKKN